MTSETPETVSPAFPLFQFQKKFLRDKSRQKGWVKARQIGGSTTAALDVALDAIKTGNDWNMMSRTGRQAVKLLEKVAKHVRACNEYAVKVLSAPPIIDSKSIRNESIALLNGASIAAMPCDPDTTVGDACNWLLDEFPIFPKSHTIFGVIKPSIRWGKRIIVLGSPRGRKNKFYELWMEFRKHGTNSGWSFHCTNIEEAVAEGCPLFDHESKSVTLEEFKQQEVLDIGHDLWLQEYMCIFMDHSMVFLPYEAIKACMHTDLPSLRTPLSLRLLGRELFVGVDIGRKNDLTVIWVVSPGPNGFTTLCVVVLEKTPFQQQEEQIEEILRTGRVSKCFIDAQGIGSQLTENLETRWPGMVEPVNFTNPLKDQMSTRLKTHMLAGEFHIPSDEDILDDFYSVEKSFTESGRPVISAPRSKAGHADRFWAAALALHAATSYEPFRVVMAG